MVVELTVGDGKWLGFNPGKRRLGQPRFGGCSWSGPSVAIT